MAPLHHAAMLAHQRMVELLLQFGADPLALSSCGSTPREFVLKKMEERSLELFQFIPGDPKFRLGMPHDKIEKVCRLLLCAERKRLPLKIIEITRNRLFPDLAEIVADYCMFPKEAKAPWK